MKRKQPKTCIEEATRIRYFPQAPIETRMQRGVLQLDIAEKEDCVQLHIHTEEGLYNVLSLSKYPLPKHEHKEGIEDGKPKRRNRNGRGKPKA